MKEKKNIDRIFQEKFKDFEQEPSEKLWSSIASKLDKKDEKKSVLIPLWAKLSGVAAVIAIIIAGILNLEDPFSSKEQIVFEKPDKSNIEEQRQDPPFKNPNKLLRSTEAVVNSKNTDLSKDKKVNSQIHENLENTDKPAISSGIHKNRKDGAYFKKSKLAAENNNSNFSSPTTGSDPLLVPMLAEITANEPSYTAQFDSLTLKNDFIGNNTENALTSLENEKSQPDESLDGINSSHKKIQISTFAAPIYYTNTGSGNELSNQFSRNGSSSEITFSYGMKIAYHLNSKLKVRTGISKMNMSYNIQDISYHPTAASPGFENLDVVETNVEIRPGSSSTGDFTNSPSDQYVLAGIYSPGELNQQFGFIEVPVELEYSLINNKFGLNIIGGASSLFLDHNRIDLIAGNSITELGKASNINKTSFSTNLGLGLDYDISESFGISLEPIVKYQLNTFKNVDNVRPLNFGFYSGLNFKF